MNVCVWNIVKLNLEKSNVPSKRDNYPWNPSLSCREIPTNVASAHDEEHQQTKPQSLCRFVHQ